MLPSSAFLKDKISILYSRSCNKMILKQISPSKNLQSDIHMYSRSIFTGWPTYGVTVRLVFIRTNQLGARKR